MVRYFYLTTNEGDKFIESEFKGIWDQSTSRWKIPCNMIERVCAYLMLSIDKGDDEEGNVKSARISKRKKRKRKVHREDSFEEDLANSSCEESDEQILH